MIKTAARVIVGFILACLAAGVATVLFVITPGDLLSTPVAAFPAKLAQTLTWGLLAATHSAIFAAIFALIVAGVGEWLALRSAYYYLIAAAVIALLGFYAQYASEAAGQPTIFNTYAATAFLTAGLLAGFAYWLAAGRFAGVGARASGDASKMAAQTKPATLFERLSKANAKKIGAVPAQPTGQGRETVVLRPSIDKKRKEIS